MNHEMERVLRPRLRARQSYNFLSRWYDKIAASEEPCLHVGIHMLDVKPGESILEIGCGTGRMVPILSGGVIDGNVVALDISEEMLQFARKKMKKGGGQYPVDFCQADGFLLPLQDESFDAVFLGFTLELFDTPDIAQVLGGCRRVLKQNGRMGIVALEKQEAIGVRIYEWFHGWLPEFVDCRPIPLQWLLAEAHFTIEQSMTKLMWGLPVGIVLAKKSGRV